MKRVILFFGFILLLFSVQIYAQGKNELSLQEQKKIILFLIDKHEIYTNDSNWRSYLDAIFYRQIFKNDSIKKNEIYVFSTKSTHTSYFFLLKQGSSSKILNANSINDDIGSLLDFFKSNTNISSKELLEVIEKIIETYHYNQNSNRKIPITSHVYLILPNRKVNGLLHSPI